MENESKEKKMKRGRSYTQIMTFYINNYIQKLHFYKIKSRPAAKIQYYKWNYTKEIYKSKQHIHITYSPVKKERGGHRRPRPYPPTSGLGTPLAHGRRRPQGRAGCTPARPRRGWGRGPPTAAAPAVLAAPLPADGGCASCARPRRGCAGAEPATPLAPLTFCREKAER
ncbi:unnamed protein product [Urochloa humidicola]